MKGIVKQEIAINGSMLDEHPTGVGTYTFNLINHLFNIWQQDGLKNITVFTPSKSYINKQIRTIKLPTILLSSRYGRIAAASRLLWNIFSYPVHAKKYTILISPSTHGALLLKNQIITVHDLISLHFDNISTHQRFYFKRLLPQLLKNARVIVAVSETTKKDIIRYFSIPENKIHVIHNGYDTERYFPLAQPVKTIGTKFQCGEYFLAVGATYPHKNFELLIDAYHSLPQSITGRFHLLIAGGKDEYLLKLKNKVMQLDLEGSVIFTGYVSAEIMPDLYREAFALIYPSLYEGFGIPLLEAMASGCPVIVSNAASMPEVCGEAALYVDPTSMEDLKNTIQRLVCDPRLRANLVNKGVSRASKFSWKKMATDFDSLITTSFSGTKN